MAEYLAPGVYVEERDSGSAPLEGVSTSTVGFLGPTERGPTTPRLLTSGSDFRRWYGGHLDDSFLPTAVDGFFRNGGSRCFLGRISATDEVAEAKLSDDGSNGTDVIRIEAVGPGSWGERLVAIVSNASMHGSDENLFRLTIRYWRDVDDAEDAKAVMDTSETTDVELPEPDIEEVFDDLSTEKRADGYVENKVNGSSALVEVSVEAPGDRPGNHVTDTGRRRIPSGSPGAFRATRRSKKRIMPATIKSPPRNEPALRGSSSCPTSPSSVPPTRRVTTA